MGWKLILVNYNIYTERYKEHYWKSDTLLEHRELLDDAADMTGTLLKNGDIMQNK